MDGSGDRKRIEVLIASALQTWWPSKGAILPLGKTGCFDAITMVRPLWTELFSIAPYVIGLSFVMILTYASVITF